MTDEKDWRIDLIRTYFLPLLDKQHEWDEDVSDELVEEAEVALAEAYLDEGRGVLSRFAKVGGPLVVVDALFVMPAQIYGLVFSMVGTWVLLVEGDFRDRFAIATQSQTWSGTGFRQPMDSSEKKRLAHEAVVTNLGLVWLTAGFVFQILALVFFPTGNAISLDWLTN